MAERNNTEMYPSADAPVEYWLQPWEISGDTYTFRSRLYTQSEDGI